MEYSAISRPNVSKCADFGPAFCTAFRAAFGAPWRGLRPRSYFILHYGKFLPLDLALFDDDKTYAGPPAGRVMKISSRNSRNLRNRKNPHKTRAPASFGLLRYRSRARLRPARGPPGLPRSGSLPPMLVARFRTCW